MVKTISEPNLLSGALLFFLALRPEKEVFVSVCAFDMELLCSYNMMTRINHPSFSTDGCETLSDVLISEPLWLQLGCC